MGRILIIEDDDQVRTLLQLALESEDHEVYTAENGNEGLRIYREQLTELVITDIIMPEKEGIETIIELHREFPNLKIIAISGGGRVHSGDYLAMAKKLGAVKTFSKPIDIPRFLQSISELL